MLAFPVSGGNFHAFDSAKFGRYHVFGQGLVRKFGLVEKCILTVFIEHVISIGFVFHGQ